MPELLNATAPATRVETEPALVQRTASANRLSVFKYYIHDSVSTLRFDLIGDLAGRHVTDLNGCWETAKVTLAGRKLVLDLKQLRSADEEGVAWLKQMALAGAQYQPGPFVQDKLAAQGASMDIAACKKQPLWTRVLGLLRGTCEAE